MKSMSKTYSKRINNEGICERFSKWEDARNNLLIHRKSNPFK